MSNVNVPLTATDVDLIAFALSVAENEGLLDLSNPTNAALWRKFERLDIEMNRPRNNDPHR